MKHVSMEVYNYISANRGNANNVYYVLPTGANNNNNANNSNAVVPD